ncbi:hypothetical protein PAPHI01_0545 [Pancytospora philotis]|nr:hypothetical protein PAPHI01_0545 [Pancytospora philotis]
MLACLNQSAVAAPEPQPSAYSETAFEMVLRKSQEDLFKKLEPLRAQENAKKLMDEMFKPRKLNKREALASEVDESAADDTFANMQLCSFYELVDEPSDEDSEPAQPATDPREPQRGKRVKRLRGALVRAAKIVRDKCKPHLIRKRKKSNEPPKLVGNNLNDVFGKMLEMGMTKDFGAAGNGTDGRCIFRLSRGKPVSPQDVWEYSKQRFNSIKHDKIWTYDIFKPWKDHPFMTYYMHDPVFNHFAASNTGSEADAPFISGAVLEAVRDMLASGGSYNALSEDRKIVWNEFVLRRNIFQMYALLTAVELYDLGEFKMSYEDFTRTIYSYICRRYNDAREPSPIVEAIQSMDKFELGLVNATTAKYHVRLEKHAPRVSIGDYVARQAYDLVFNIFVLRKAVDDARGGALDDAIVEKARGEVARHFERGGLGLNYACFAGAGIGLAIGIGISMVCMCTNILSICLACFAVGRCFCCCPRETDTDSERGPESIELVGLD